MQIKPNVNSWRSITVSNMYNTSFNYKRNLDSHMMKNTEWGAMAYLTNSKYGRGNTEVGVNSNTSFITGCTNTTTYFNNSTGASTTNNYSGIYDTSGGAFEQVMGNLNNNSLASGLVLESISNKYINRYTGTNLSCRILGDATGETCGWNDDSSNMSVIDSWFYRGGGNEEANAVPGVFSFVLGGGGPYGHASRIVLSPSN